MLIGSGLLARAFAPSFLQSENVCVYAAGVSNSGCTDTHEFARERHRLMAALRLARHVDTFVYFGTCSVADPEAQNTPYVQHKLGMEQLVSAHPYHLIFRLPQVAGKTPNPHTLLNFLYARIARSEAFTLWKNARRNIIDVDDVVSIARQLIMDKTVQNTILNIANPVSYSMPDIVGVMERVIGKPAIYDSVERGSGYSIDISATLSMLDEAAVQFGENYLEQTISKYYGGIS